jgi:hypothetical protein
MSLTALDWMMNRAEMRGVRFHADARAAYKAAADVNDKRYDSRAGLGVFYRWTPRDIQALCQRCNVRPQVHRSVFERIARNTEGYAPGSLPVLCEVVSTSASRNVRDELSAIVAGGFDSLPPLVQRTRKRQRIGQVGYTLMVITMLTSGVLVLAEYVKQSRGNAQDWEGLAAGLANNSISSRWLNVIAVTIWNYPWVILFALASMLLVVWTDSWLDTYYSSFWHRLREKLRLAM